MKNRRYQIYIIFYAYFSFFLLYTHASKLEVTSFPNNGNEGVENIEYEKCLKCGLSYKKKDKIDNLIDSEFYINSYKCINELGKSKKDVVLFLGAAGSGKSSLIKEMLGIPLCRKPCVEKVKEKDKKGKIVEKTVEIKGQCELVEDTEKFAKRNLFICKKRRKY